MENLNDMFDLNNLIGRLRRIENDPAAQFEDIEAVSYTHLTLPTN